MSKSLRVLLLVAALLATCLAGRTAWAMGAEEAAGEDHGDVVVLTADNFDDFVAGDLTLVEFYAPWCGHCKSLAPHYKQAATALLADGIKLGKVDATVERELAGRFNVQGYPTMKVFRQGEPADYKGPRTADGIAAYMRKQAGPAAKPVEASLEAVTQFALSDRSTHFAVLGFFGGDADSQRARATFTKAAGDLREQYVWGLVEGAEAQATLAALVKDEQVRLPAFVGVQTIGSTPQQPKLVPVVFSGKPADADATSVKAWVQDAALPLVAEFNDQTHPMFHRKGLPVAKLYTEVDWATASNAKMARYYLVRLRKALAGFEGKLTGALVNKEQRQAAIELDNLGLNPSEADYFVVVEELDHQKKYVFHPEKKGWDAKAVEAWFAKYVAGEVTPHVKSEPEPTPEEAAADPVVKVVGSNLEKVLFSPEKKSVLFEVYAPWCGHCKSLEPKFKAAAEGLAAHKDKVILAKLDGTANDYPRDLFDVSGYPSLFWVQDGDAQKIESYEGGRETADIINFVKKQLKLK